MLIETRVLEPFFERKITQTGVTNFNTDLFCELGINVACMLNPPSIHMAASQLRLSEQEGMRGAKSNTSMEKHFIQTI